MKKSLVLIFGLFNIIHTSAQVGVGTSTPQSILDIAGDLHFTKDLSVGGDALSKGNSGNINDILYSKGAGVSPVWMSPDALNIPKEVSLLKKSTTSSYKNSNSSYIIPFDEVGLINSNYLSFDENLNPTSFNILKAGNYQITIYLRYELLLPETSEGIVTTNIVKNGDNLSGQTSGFGNSINFIDQNFTITDRLSVNDVISINSSYTKAYRIVSSTLSVQYLGV